MGSLNSQAALATLQLRKMPNVPPAPSKVLPRSLWMLTLRALLRPCGQLAISLVGAGCVTGATGSGRRLLDRHRGTVRVVYGNPPSNAMGIVAAGANASIGWTHTLAAHCGIDRPAR
jgi:hypothetical protein